MVMCSKERSCEVCRETLPPIPPRTIPNELMARCSTFIPDESKVRKIYVEVKTKLWPGHYKIIDSLLMIGKHQYDSTFNLKKYLNMNDYNIGDTFLFRGEVRWKFTQPSFFGDKTLIY